jgi:hypothetical protein
VQAIEAVGAEQTEAQESQMRRTLSSFLNRIYYDLRNLGQTSQDRALNFACEPMLSKQHKLFLRLWVQGWS